MNRANHLILQPGFGVPLPLLGSTNVARGEIVGFDDGSDNWWEIHRRQQ